ALGQLQPVRGDGVVAGSGRRGDERGESKKNERRVVHVGEIIAPFPCRESRLNSALPSGRRRIPAPRCSWLLRSRRPPSRCTSARPLETQRRVRRPPPAESR